MNMRNLALLGVVLFLLIALVTVMTTSSGTAGRSEITYSEFQRQVDGRQIKEATIKGNKVTAVIDGQRQVAVLPRDGTRLRQKLTGQGRQREGGGRRVRRHHPELHHSRPCPCSSSSACGSS